MNTFRYLDGQLFCEATPLAEIAAMVGTPVYVYSQAALWQRAMAYQEAAGMAAPAAAPLVCYAVKANGNPELLRLVAQAGLGADVTSGGELFLAQHAGIAPDKIIFSGVGKTRPEIEAALRAGIRALHVESEMEVAVVAEVAAQLRQAAAIGVRVNPDIRVATHPYISTGAHVHKFGVTLEQARRILHLAADHRWLKPVGLAVHLGSQITDLEPFRQSAHFLLTTAGQLAAEGIRLAYLDVGGGLGINYDHHNAPEITAWVPAVASLIAAAGYDVVMEPGRSLIGPTGALLTQVLYTKEQGQKHFVIADAGMGDLIRPTLYNAYHPIWPARQPGANGDEVTVTVDIVGPICESGDFLARERPLPPTQPGDLLAVLQAGAYGFAMSSNYNGRPKAAEVLVDKDQFRIIRQRQRYEHLLDGCP
jgi:diaminopimelate decarboxylase